jgi:proteasome alpha subunit
MTMPFYVSPEQQMRDRADYARQGIAQARSVIVLQYDGGLLFAAENPSPALHKVSEIYDKIGFAAAGRYNEYENLRQAGIRMADMTGYQYDRVDVSARMLANRYAAALGTIFSAAGEKPYEVQLAVAEVGDTPEDDELYLVAFHGAVSQERGFTVMGGSADQINTFVESRYEQGLALGPALRLAAEALGQDSNGNRTLESGQLEVAVLDRTRKQKRKFRRLRGEALARLLTPETGSDAEPTAEKPAETPTEPDGDAIDDMPEIEDPDGTSGSSDQPGQDSQ